MYIARQVGMGLAARFAPVYTVVSPVRNFRLSKSVPSSHINERIDDVPRPSSHEDSGDRGGTPWLKFFLTVGAAIAAALLLSGCDFIDKLFKKKKKKSSEEKPEPESATPTSPKFLVGEGKNMQSARLAMRKMGESIIMSSQFRVDCHKQKIHIDYVGRPSCEKIKTGRFKCTGLWKEIYCTRRYKIGRYRVKKDRFTINNSNL